MVCLFQINKVLATKSKSSKGFASPSTIIMLSYNNGQHCQIAGNSCGYFTDSSYLVIQVSHNYRLGTERSVLWHQGEIRGYGKKVMNRDNPQPSPKDYSNLWMQFRDSMSVGYLLGGLR